MPEQSGLVMRGMALLGAIRADGLAVQAKRLTSRLCE